MLMAKSANSKINSRSSLAIHEEGLRQSAIAVTVVVIIMIMIMMMMMMLMIIMIIMIIIRHHSSSFVIIINRKNHIMIFSVLDVSAIRSYTGSLQLAGALASFTKNSTRIMAISGSFPQKVHLPNK
jgi:hypothetical protein